MGMKWPTKLVLAWDPMRKNATYYVYIYIYYDYMYIYIYIIYIYIMFASGQDAQGHLWHGSDWTATNQRGFHTSGLSCKLETFAKPRLRKMLFSASECCSNSMAPTSSSFEGKSLKKKVTWMVENRNQKHEESILIILRNRKQKLRKK